MLESKLKYFKCSQHKGENFVSYCLKCHQNLCVHCSNSHKGHNIVIFENLLKEIDKKKILNKNFAIIKEKVEELIKPLEKIKEYLNIYETIIKKLNENFESKNYNYELLKSVKNLNEMSFLEYDTEQILKCKSLTEKFDNIMLMFEMMSGLKNEVTIKVKIEEED